MKGRWDEAVASLFFRGQKRVAAKISAMRLFSEYRNKTYRQLIDEAKPCSYFFIVGNSVPKCLFHTGILVQFQQHANRIEAERGISF